MIRPFVTDLARSFDELAGAIYELGETNIQMLRVFEEHVASLPAWLFWSDQQLEAEYRRATGQRPPGSWKTKRLRKKRMGAIYPVLIASETPIG
jgi:hypothetical protein